MSTPERWLPIPGWEDLYEVSSHGRVRKIALKPCFNKKGYPLVSLSRDGVSQKFLVHRLVMLAFVGPCPDGLMVRHLNGDPADARWPENLLYGTAIENAADKKLHGTDWQLNKTHCPQGHPYDEENTIHTNRGGRLCRTCVREKGRKQARRRRESGLVPKYSELTEEERAVVRRRVRESTRRYRARKRQENLNSG